MSHHPPLSEQIRQLLDYLRSISPDSPDWDAIETTVASLSAEVEEIMAAQRVERGKREAKRQQEKALHDLVQSRLETLQSLPNSLLEFFDLVDCRRWSEPAVSGDRLAETAQQLEQLHETLESYARGQERARLSLLEARSAEPELSRLTRRYDELIGPLRAAFSMPAVARSSDGSVMPPPPKAEPPVAPRPAPTAPPAAPSQPHPPPKAEPPVAPLPAAPAPPAAPSQPPPTPKAEPPVAPRPAATSRPTSPPEPKRTPVAGKPPKPAPQPPLPHVTPLAEQSLTPEEQITFFWEQLGQGDLVTSYWIARSLQAQSLTPPLPDWALAAAQGAWWLYSVRGSLAQDLAELAYKYEPKDSADEKLLCTAAALLPTLAAPDTGLGSWLHPDPGLPEACSDVIDAVREFGYQGQMLRPEVIRMARGLDNRRDTLRRHQEAAREWLATAPHRRPGFQRATAVWRRWTGQNGTLRKMMSEVAAGDSCDVETLRQLVSEWRQRSTHDWVNLTDTEIQGRNMPHDRQIVGPVLEYLVNSAEEAIQLAEDCLGLASGGAEETSRFFRSIDRLSERLERAQSEAVVGLKKLIADPSSPYSDAVLTILLGSLETLFAYLRLEESPPIPGAHFPQGVETDLYSGLRYGLLLIPEAEPADDSRAAPAHLTHLTGFLKAAHNAGRTPLQAFALYLQRADYRFCPSLIANMASDAAATGEKYLVDARAHSFSFLENQLRATGDQIEQAIIDRLIDEGERAELVDQLEAIKASSSENFGLRFQRLETVQARLGDARAERLSQQRTRWKSIQERLGSTDFLTREKPAYKELAQIVEDLLARQDIVVIDERLSRLEELLDQREVPNLEEFVIQPQEDVYRHFIETLGQWERDRNLRILNTRDLLEDINQNRSDTIASLQLIHLPKPRLNEFEDAIRSWRQLKQTGQQADRETVQRHVVVLLRDYLGFTLLKPSLSQAISWRDRGPDWAHLSIELADGDLSPLPQFGSQQAGRYDVVVLWERPSAETVGARLHNLKLKAGNILVIYLGALKTRQRVEQMHYNRQSALSVAILDHYLLLFLGRYPTARLPLFFRCALPLARINPYAETGPVPAEMFMGREAEMAGLLNATGYSLVHGGRQLGKSALLQAVQRHFHNPAADQYVLREDIKEVGDPVSRQPDPDQIWERLQRGMDAKLGLIKTEGKPETILAQIEAMMTKYPNRRILVLLDEADNFLAADYSPRNFELVNKLKALMDATDRRFKVILAGLHNVQRYVNVPNQPLAHLAPLVVKPLDPVASRQLIVKPLEALGFRFIDETPILGILAYSNSHPGLIQLLCHRLLEMLYRQRPTQLEPYTITREDVEAVYRQAEVQEGIRKRFEWTLALDPRYKALAQIMVLEQLYDRDSYARPFNAPELLELSRGYWREAFQQTELEEFRGYLNEMVALGVLVYNSERNEYRLRSPNLVRLMGSVEDILASLGELTAKAIAPRFAPESHRTPLERRTGRYNPFTLAQSRALATREFGVGLIFGSPALGIDLAAEAIQTQFVPLERCKVSEIRLSATGGRALSQWLEKTMDDENRVSEGLIVFRHLNAAYTADSMIEQVRAAIAFARRHRRARRWWMRVLFIIDPAATLEWLRIPPGIREQLESEVNASVRLRCWDRIGLEQRLQQNGKMAIERVARRIEEGLGGWPWLLDRLSDTWTHTDDDPLRDFDRLMGDLQKEPLRGSFLKATGADLDAGMGRVLQAIAHYGVVPLSDAVPGVLDETVSDESCRAYIEYFRRLSLIQIVDNAIEADPIVAGLMVSP